MAGKRVIDSETPRSSWTSVPGRVSALAALAAEDPNIEVSQEVRARADRELDKRIQPYRAGLISERLTRRVR